MPVRAGLGRIQRTRQQSEDARLLRDYTNYVRANQRLHFQLLDSIMSNERNLFSLINQSNTPTLPTLPTLPDLNPNIFDNPSPVVTTETWGVFNQPSIWSRMPLTINEIDTATEYRTFGSLPNEQQRYPTCPITMNTFQDDDIVMQIHGCEHYFNPHSLRTHLSTQDTCPYCRYNIREGLLEIVGNGISTGDASGNTVNSDASGNAVNSDASGNTVDSDASGNTMDASGNASINASNASVFYQIANNLASNSY